MPRTLRGKDDPHEADVFDLRRNVKGGWDVKQGATWRHADELFCSAPTLYRPDGSITGRGVVTRSGGILRITA